MSFKHRHKASDAEELLKGFAPANSNADSMERAESASLLSPTSQSSATTVMRKGVTTPRKAAAPPEGKSESGWVPGHFLLVSLAAWTISDSTTFYIWFQSGKKILPYHWGYLPRLNPAKVPYMFVIAKGFSICNGVNY